MAGRNASIGVPVAGIQRFQFSAVEDGFELDRFVLMRMTDSNQPVPGQAEQPGGRDAIPSIGPVRVSSLTLLLLLSRRDNRLSRF